MKEEELKDLEKKLWDAADKMRKKKTICAWHKSFCNKYKND